MARARNIKPGFFLNELLGVADPFVQLLFAGLWCLADKEGRIEDRPLRIKAEIFPYREGLDIHGHLTELSRLGFILRYSVEGKNYIEINNFKKHQNPHHTEKNSVIPPSCVVTVKPPLEDGGNLPDSLIPDSLIPDSLNLIPDSLKKKEKEGDKSPLETIFSVGVKILTDAGVSDRNARSILGKYTKQDKEKLAGIIGQMSLLNPVDPVAYLTKAMQPKKREFVE